MKYLLSFLPFSDADLSDVPLTDYYRRRTRGSLDVICDSREDAEKLLGRLIGRIEYGEIFVEDQKGIFCRRRIGLYQSFVERDDGGLFRKFDPRDKEKGCAS